MPTREHGFLDGLLLGVMLSLGGGLLLLYVLTTLGLVSVSLLAVPPLQLVLDWSARNLGLSVIPFAITLLLYAHTLRTLRRRLALSCPPDEIAQLEHLADVWISLFFGIGVIWTAIGMRSALLFALDDPTAATQAGAHAVLGRLVEGGILTALTTTIVGGIGGYLMRILKSSLLGARLNRYYEACEHAHAGRVESLLADIRASLRRTTPVHRQGGEVVT